MDNKASYWMTESGKRNLAEELDYLKTVKRSKVIDRIKYARTFCDFAEDSEFDEAIQEQVSVEKRISQLEDMLHHAEIITSSNEQKDIVTIGSTVTYLEMPDGE